MTAQIAFVITALNDLDFLARDIGNADIQVPTRKKECSTKEGEMATIT